jgi:hypothetical protein
MFGKTKNKIDSILINTFSQKPKFKNAFHTLMESLKDNPTNREFFVLYSQIENKAFSDIKDAEEYLNESIKTLKSKKNKVNLKNINESISKYKNFIGDSTNKLYESIDTLVFNESVLGIEKRIEAKKLILKKLHNRETKKISEAKIPNSLLINLSTKNFNKKYENLTENDKLEFKSLLGKNNIEFKNEFETLVEEVTTKLDNLISETKDFQLLGKLNETKEKISKTVIDKVSYYKIKELNKTL